MCDELGDGETRLLELGIQMFSAVCPMMSERLDVKHRTKLAQDSIFQIEKKFDGERFQVSKLYHNKIMILYPEEPSSRHILASKTVYLNALILGTNFGDEYLTYINIYLFKYNLLI